MANIIQMVTEEIGEAGQLIRRVRIITTDNLATITTANWLNSSVLKNWGQVILPSDFFTIWYGYVSSANPGTFELFTPSIVNGVITLVQWSNPGNVLLPVVSGDIAIFNGTTGQIKDSGVTISGTSGTVPIVTTPTIANHIATYTNTTGTLSEDPATAISAGNIQAGTDAVKGQLLAYGGSSNGHIIINPIGNTGDTAITIQNAIYGQATVLTIPDPGVTTSNFLLSDSTGTQHITTGSLSVDLGNLAAGSSGHAGTLASFPGTAANGELIVAAVDAGGAFNTTISNGTMGQSTVYTIGDIGAATGGLVVATSAIRMKSVAQAAVAGGAAAQTITDAFCTTGSMVTASWNDTTNAVSIQKVAAGNGSFVVTSSGDPGASHLNYIITK